MPVEKNGRGKQLQQSWRLDEFFAVLHLIEPCQQENEAGEEDEEAVVKDCVVEDLGVAVDGDVKGVEEDVPAADLQGFAETEQNEPDDDDEYCRAIAVAHHGAQHEAEQADEKHGHHDLQGEV